MATQRRNISKSKSKSLSKSNKGSSSRKSVSKTRKMIGGKKKGGENLGDVSHSKTWSERWTTFWGKKNKPKSSPVTTKVTLISGGVPINLNPAQLKRVNGILAIQEVLEKRKQNQNKNPKLYQAVDPNKNTYNEARDFHDRGLTAEQVKKNIRDMIELQS